MFQVRDLDRSQELGILHEGVEVESETSLMGFIFVKIRFHTKAYSRYTNRESRWT